MTFGSRGTLEVGAAHSGRDLLLDQCSRLFFDSLDDFFVERTRLLFFFILCASLSFSPSLFLMPRLSRGQPQSWSGTSRTRLHFFLASRRTNGDEEIKETGGNSFGPWPCHTLCSCSWLLIPQRSTTLGRRLRGGWILAPTKAAKR